MPLQKSFSDQNHSSKARQQNRAGWSRNNSYHGRDSSKQKPLSRPLQEKPSIPVSTATKAKLSNFLAQANNENVQKTVITLLSDDDKENSRSSGRRREDNSQSPEERPDNKSQMNVKEAAEASPLPSLLKTNRLPATPASRLALPDLIGMSDVQRAVEAISPDDQIRWDHRKDGSQEGSTPFSRTRRVKKRARSSSPVSSPHSNGESPQLDPGSELWGRYSLNGTTAPTSQGPSVPALAHLMQTSSPQPSKDGITPRILSGLRRSTSCGTSFPKRRRVGDSDRDVFTESARIGPSRLSVLIERIQEDISHPKLPEPDTEPSNLRKGAYESALCSIEETSPTDHKESRLTPPAQYIPRTKHPIPETPVRRQERKTYVSNSSDYGDFDDDELDASVLNALESQLIEVSTKSNPSKSYLPSNQSRQPLQSPRKTPLLVPLNEESFDTLKGDDDDEFGDFDDDVFGDLEQVVSQFDRQSPISKARKIIYSVPKAAKVLPTTDSDDEFGDDGIDEDDLEAAVAATQSLRKTNDLLSTARKMQAIQRYLVTHVTTSEYDDETTKRICKEKVLLLAVESTKVTRIVILRGFWYLSPVTEKAYVHVIGDFVGSRCIIDNNHNMLILHPDHLVSSTVVADSFSCTRRAVLQDRVKATGDAASPMVYGTILHEIFQAAMVANRWDTEYLHEVIEDITIKHVEDLYTIRIQIKDAIQYLQSKMGELQSWAQLFVSSQVNPEAIVKDRHGETAHMCITKLLDVEEHVWSPMYGLKGNIDATVQVTMQDSKRKNRRTLTVPFEVKTGKNPNASHRAQTALYNLLISDRYDMEVAYGILYYMETSETIRIPKFRNELIHMVMKRNELACYVRERHAELPAMEKKENLCGRCYAKVPCFIYHKLADNGTGETSGMGAKFDEVVKHLTPKHKEFFLKWDDLLTKEEKESMKFRRELWTMLSSEREKLGRCFSNVVVEPGSGHEDILNAKINRFTYTMTKQEAAPGFSFLESQIIVGEPIVISDEKGHFALANGYVTKVGKRRITVAVDRRLHNARIRQPGFSEVDNQVFSSIMQVGMSPNELLEQKPHEEPIQYRLDKDEFSNGMATVRNNLIQVMTDGPYGSRQIRGLVVDLNAPRFKTENTAYVLQGDEGLNGDQRTAIQKVMSAEDYALVLGMPGTGKTTTIAHIIRALVSQKKSVLLTSYTHSAVDNILLKLKDDEIKTLRLGNVAKIHPDVQKFAVLAATTKASFEDIRSAWHDTPVVATTCLGVNHAIFNERTFDYCIVDEASQITLPVCLGPIRLAKTFILVGDHNQLPPLVQNEEARAGGLDISLFKHLSDAQPSSVVYLEHQYRMCKDIMTLSNDLIYQGRLKCGSDEVANRKIIIPNIDGLRIHHFSPSTLSLSQRSICTGPSRGRCWIRDVLDPATKVAFLNTDTLLPGAREQAKGNRIVNPTEATICTQLVESLLSTGVEPSSIGVMTHYRSQLALFKHNLRHHADVEMHTADRFQGRDKEVIILSLVRSNEARSVGELLKDWRRINVAFTRAKTKLLVIGSRETLKGNGKDKDGNEKEEMIAEFVKLLEVKNWIYDMPKTALEDHYFEEWGTQATATSRLNSTQFKILEEAPNKVKSSKRKTAVLGEGKENQGLKNGKRMPNKQMVGQKPFKIPRQSVLADIYDEAVGI